MNHQPLRRYPQLTLGTLLLMVTAVSILLAWHRVHKQVSEVQQQVMALTYLARELRIDDPEKISVVTRMPTLSQELILDFYLPPGSSSEPAYQLCLALEGISHHGNSQSLYPDPEQSIAVASGIHAVEVRHKQADNNDPDDQHEIEILLDDQVVFQAQRPASWQPSNGWSSTGSYTESKAFAPDQPVEIHRRRFNQPMATGSRGAGRQELANGILLWLQPIDRPTDPLD